MNGAILMENYRYIKLMEEPALKDEAATWFHNKWGVPREAYLECMEAYLNHETEYGWYLCLDGRKIIGGMGVIENDFHDRKDLAPNVCAVYTEEDYRGQGIAGKLLNIVVTDMKEKGISPIYLITDHIGFYGSVKNFVALVKNDSFLVRITDMTILIEKEFIYGSSKRPNPTDYYRKQHYQCG